MPVVGSLRYDVIVDTQDFVKGMTVTRSEWNKARKVSRDAQTDIEKFSKDVQDLTSLMAKGAVTSEEYGRTIAQLASKFDDADKQGQELADAMRRQAQEILDNTGYVRSLTKEEAALVQRLNASAEAIERNTRETRKNADIARRTAIGKAAAAEKEKLAAQETAEAQRKLTERQKRVRQEVDRATPAIVKQERRLKELRQEYERGSLSNQEYVRTQRSIRNETNNTASSLGRTSGALGVLTRNVGLLTAGFSAASFATNSFRKAMDLGQAQASFGVFTGSVEKGVRTVEDLRRFSAQTPLTFGATAQAGQILLQSQVAAEDLIPTLRALGDVAGGVDNQFQRLALAYSQARNAQRLMGGEVKQFREAGFNVLGEIAKNAGESVAEARDRMADGAIGIDELTRAFQTATAEGGIFANRMEEISQTSAGAILRMQGDIERLQTDIGTLALEGTTAQVNQFSEGLGLLQFGFDKLGASLPAFINALLPIPGRATKGTEALKRLREEQERLKSAIDGTTEAAEEQAEVAAEISEGEQQAQSIIDQLEERNMLLREGREAVALYNAEQAGASEEQLQEIERLQERNRLIEEGKKEEEERRREEDAFEQRAEQAADDAKKRAQQIKASLADTLTPIEEAAKQIEEIRQLADRGALSEDEAFDLEGRVAAGLADDQLEEDRKRQEAFRKQEVSMVRANSAEEFKLLSSLRKQEDNDEERRHRERQSKLIDIEIALIDLLGVEPVELEENVGVGPEGLF